MMPDGPARQSTQRKEQRMTQAALAYLKSNRLLNYSARSMSSRSCGRTMLESRRSSILRTPFRPWARVSFSVRLQHVGGDDCMSGRTQVEFGRRLSSARPTLIV